MKNSIKNVLEEVHNRKVFIEHPYSTRKMKSGTTYATWKKLWSDIVCVEEKFIFTEIQHFAIHKSVKFLAIIDMNNLSI